MDSNLTIYSIVIIVYLICYCAKLLPMCKDEYIPAIAGISGGLLGILGLFCIKDFPADNLFDAFTVGIMSGFASTGVNQLYKQGKEGKKK